MAALPAGGKPRQGEPGALEVCWALIKAVCPQGVHRHPSKQNSLHLKYPHLKESGYNAN